MTRAARPRRLRADATAASSVVGAIVVLAILSLSIVYVNSVHVPRQGAAIETAAQEDAQAALTGLAAALARGGDASIPWDVALRPAAAPPSLLSGIILSPARADGSLSVGEAGSTLRISTVVPAPAGGVPANDPMREDLGNGTMRVHLLGATTGPRALGALEARVGGAYLQPAQLRVEGGALIALRDEGSALLEGPALRVARGGTADAPLTTVAWSLPLLSGPADRVSGAASAVASFEPGATGAIGGIARAQELRIEITTDALAAWRLALEEAVGAHGTVSVAAGAAPDAGTVTAVIRPQADAAAGSLGVSLDLRATLYATTLSARSAS